MRALAFCIAVLLFCPLALADIAFLILSDPKLEEKYQAHLFNDVPSPGKKAIVGEVLTKIEILAGNKMRFLERKVRVKPLNPANPKDTKKKVVEFRRDHISGHGLLSTETVESLAGEYRRIESEIKAQKNKCGRLSGKPGWFACQKGLIATRERQMHWLRSNHFTRQPGKRLTM